MTAISFEELIAAVDDTAVQTATESLESHFDRTCLVQDLFEGFVTDGVVLALGAGVGMSCGVPSWSELLLQLHGRGLAEVGGVDLTSLANVYAQAVSTESPLVSARLAAGPGTDDSNPDFRNKLRTILYASNPEPSDLVRALARIANHCEGRKGIRGVLTYNYDVLLEEELTSIGRVFDRLDRSDRGMGYGLPIRHVHGFLERSQSNEEWIILTEAAYHREYGNPFTWSNVIQLNAFRENVCLFIGLSMTDPNVRRLLEFARQTAMPKHYAMLKRTSATAVSEQLNAVWATRGYARGRPSEGEWRQVQRRIDLACMLADTNRSQALSELGVKVIWLNSYDEIPQILTQMSGMT